MRVAKDGQEIHAGEAAGSSSRRSALVDISAQPRHGDPSVRLLRCGHSDVPDVVRVRGDRAQHAAAGAYQCDGASERRLDAAAVAGSGREWRRASLPDPRPRSDLRQAPRRFDQGSRGRSIAITCCESQGECHLRARHRDSTKGMFRLANPIIRGASTCDSQMLGDTLQRRTSA